MVPVVLLVQLPKNQAVYLGVNYRFYTRFAAPDPTLDSKL